MKIPEKKHECFFEHRARSVQNSLWRRFEPRCKNTQTIAVPGVLHNTAQTALKPLESSVVIGRGSCCSASHRETVGYGLHFSFFFCPYAIQNLAEHTRHLLPFHMHFTNNTHLLTTLRKLISISLLAKFNPAAPNSGQFLSVLPPRFTKSDLLDVWWGGGLLTLCGGGLNHKRLLVCQ